MFKTFCYHKLVINFSSQKKKTVSVLQGRMWFDFDLYNTIFSNILNCSAPTGLHLVERSSTSITIKWQPLPVGDLYNILSGYRIKYTKSGSGDYASIDIKKSDQIQCEITNLEKSTTYEIWVARLYLSGSTGPYSQEIKATTKFTGNMLFENCHVYFVCLSLPRKRVQFLKGQEALWHGGFYNINNSQRIEMMKMFMQWLGEKSWF